MNERATFQSPLGPIVVETDSGAIIRVTWNKSARVVEPETGSSDLLEDTRSQLAEYFTGQRQSFDLPLHVRGSDFQRNVCIAMSEIPFGETRTYGDIAKSLGIPAQAVGQACGGNPIPIIIPCHRVLAANGLGGFSGAGGVEDKVWLLRHEGAAGLLI